jgi:hypothetical protein
MRAFHTSEGFVADVLHWLESGQLPTYFDPHDTSGEKASP